MLYPRNQVMVCRDRRAGEKPGRHSPAFPKAIIR